MDSLPTKDSQEWLVHGALEKTIQKEASLANKRDAFTKQYESRQRVQVENNNAIKVIKGAMTKETFIYADPPYIGSDQGHYKRPASEDNYRELLDALSKVKESSFEFLPF